MVLASLALFVASMAGAILLISQTSPDGIVNAKATELVGNVTIAVGMTLSITTEDDNSLSLSCLPGGMVFTNESEGGPDALCKGFSPDGIIVRNDGTYDANLSVAFSDYGEAHGGSFLNSSTDDSWISFSIANETDHVMYAGGCFGNLQSAWENVTSNSSMTACDRLLHGTDNSVTLYMAFYIPPNVTGVNSLTVDFLASLSP